MQADGVLVRFGEIGIKSAPVRRAMLERLRGNLLALMERDGVEGDVLRMGARLWMAGPDTGALAGVASRTFGVVSARPARRVPARMEDIGAAAAQAALAVPDWASFAIRARREGTHPFTSQDVGVQAGAAVFRAAEAAGRAPKVDLGTPDLEVEVDVRAAEAFVSTADHAGPGGLPMGSQGRVLALLSDEASFVAAWLVARRGCHVALLHAGDTGSLPADAVAALARWGLPHEVEVLPVCSGAVAKPALLEAAATVARGLHAQALVTGETLASRLLAASLPTAGGAAAGGPAPLPVPVLRPVCGLDPEEYGRWRDRIGLPASGYPDPILRAEARETAASLLSMRRVVTA